MKTDLLIALIVFLRASRVISFIGGIDDLSFGGDGDADCYTSGNCEYQFSSGFRGDICNWEEYGLDKAGVYEDDVLAWLADNLLGLNIDDCWGMLTVRI